MNKVEKKIQKNKSHRKLRIRAKISGTNKRPRLSVFKSNRGIFAQLIDDENSKTLISVNMKELKTKGKTNQAVEIGKLLASKAKENKIETAVFDRGGNKYHGRIKALADAAREAGLQI